MCILPTDLGKGHEQRSLEKRRAHLCFVAGEAWGYMWRLTYAPGQVVEGERRKQYSPGCPGAQYNAVHTQQQINICSFSDWAFNKETGPPYR